MKEIPNSFAIGKAGAGSERAPVRVVAFGAGDLSAGQTHHICADLLPEFGRDRELDLSSWSFGKLAADAEFKAALNAARVADIIVLASPSNEELPAVVRACLDHALAGHDRACGTLIALLIEPHVKTPGAGSVVDRCLRRAAHEAGIQYLVQWLDSAGLPGLTSASEAQPKPTRTAASFEPPIHPGDYREWGIND
jgi:hypothetical protein